MTKESLPESVQAATPMMLNRNWGRGWWRNFHSNVVILVYLANKHERHIFVGLQHCVLALGFAGKAKVMHGLLRRMHSRVVTQCERTRWKFVKNVLFVLSSLLFELGDHFFKAYLLELERRIFLSQLSIALDVAHGGIRHGE